MRFHVSKSNVKHVWNTSAQFSHPLRASLYCKPFGHRYLVSKSRRELVSLTEFPGVSERFLHVVVTKVYFCSQVCVTVLFSIVYCTCAIPWGPMNVLDSSWLNSIRIIISQPFQQFYLRVHGTRHFTHVFWQFSDSFLTVFLDRSLTCLCSTFITHCLNPESVHPNRGSRIMCRRGMEE